MYKDFSINPSLYSTVATHMHCTGLLIIRGKKKSNFARFLGTKSRKNWLISREFRGNFQGKLGRKAIGKQTADFVVIFRANFARNRSVLH